MELTRGDIEQMVDARIKAAVEVPLLKLEHRLKSLYRNGDETGPPGAIEQMRKIDEERWKQQLKVNNDQNCMLNSIEAKLDEATLKEAIRNAAQDASSGVKSTFWDKVYKAAFAIFIVFLTAFVTLLFSGHVHFSTNDSQQQMPPSPLHQPMTTSSNQ